MISILVTGANGQLGQSLKKLAKTHTEYNFIFASSYDLDITNITNIKSFFKDHSFDYCINCAAYTAVDKAETEEGFARKVNVDGVRHITEACKENRVILIHISTDFVFDGFSKTPYKEEDKTNPLSIYGKTKLDGEYEVTSILKEYYILRTSWLYSEYGTNFMKTMIKLSNDREELNVVSDQIGTPTYAMDLAEIILNFVNTKTHKYGIYHYSNYGEISWYDFAKEIFKIKKIKINVIPIKTTQYFTPAKRPYYSVLDKTKIKQKLNVIIPHWKDSLKTAIANL